MELRKFFIFILCFIVSISSVYTIELNDYYDYCLSFGDIAHKNSQNLYIASLNVGTGECHIIRKGDDVVIIDAGKRSALFERQLIDRLIALMLMYKDDSEEQTEYTFRKAVLHAIFVTHPHDDHINMIRTIIANDNIERAENFSIFFGGLRDEYPGRLIDFLTDAGIVFSYTNGNRNLNGFSIRTYNVNPRFVAGQGQDINRFGAIIELSFKDRKIAFMGDIDFEGFKAVYPTRLGTFPIGRLDNRHHMADFLREADIVTVPHHGLLSHSEGCVCSSLLMNRQDRVFLVSGNPYDASFPLLSDVLVYLGQTILLKWGHQLSLYNRYFARVGQIGRICSEKTRIPLFSTYDAPHGFIWTRIRSNGDISIHDGAYFRRVLPR